MAQLPALPIPEPEWPTATKGYGAEAATIASRKWHDLIELLTERGLDVGAHETQLETYALTYARMVMAERHVAEHGPMVKAPRTGVPMQNPWLSIANKCAATLMKLDKVLQPPAGKTAKRVIKASGDDDAIEF